MKSPAIRHSKNRISLRIVIVSEANQSLPPGLYIVATPIGNLEDITLRALRVLRECDRIACEDTRQTQKLLNHFEIKKPTVSYHKHNEAGRAAELLDLIAAGERIALVSDAGTPGISDPGFRVVQQAIARGVAVIPIPGAVAFAAALAAAGLPTDEFRFLGFLPAQAGARRTALEMLQHEQATTVFYEAPHRILEALGDIVAVLGEARPVAVARELTKLHEEFLRGTAGSILKDLSGRERVRGEITLLIGAGQGSAAEASAQAGKGLTERMTELMEREQVDEREALKILAKEFGVSKSELYREWQRSRSSSRPRNKHP